MTENPFDQIVKISVEDGDITEDEGVDIIGPLTGYQLYLISKWGPRGPEGETDDNH